MGMESIGTPELLLALAVFGMGILIGVLAGRRNQEAIRRARKLEEQLEQTRNQLSQYQEQVTDHFGRTAQLLNDMTQQYRSVYQHMAEGAQLLCPEQVKNLEAGLQIPEETVEPPKLVEDVTETPVTGESAAA